MINVERTNENEGALLGGRAQMIETIERVMNEQIVPVEDLKDYVENTADWRFRLRYLPFNVHSYVGTKSLIGFEDVIRGTVFDSIRTISIFAKSGSWGVAAWELTDATAKEGVKVKNEDKAWTIFDGGSSPQKFRNESRDVECLKLTVCFVDVSKSPEQDVLLEKTGRKGAISRYLETRNSERLPQNLKKGQGLCMDLIRRRANIEEPQKDDGLFLSEAKLATVKRLRDSGVKWTDLGSMMDVDWRELRKTLKLSEGGNDDTSTSEKAV